MKAGRNKSKTGWTRPNGPPLPAFCDKCGTVFPSRAYNLGGTIFNLSVNEEPCPECGNEHALLSEGIFNLTTDIAEIVSAPAFTYEMFVKIRDVTSAIIDDKIDHSDALREIESVSPDLTKVIERSSLSFKVVGYLIATVIAAAGVYAALEANSIAREGNTLTREQTEIMRAEHKINRERWDAERAKSINTDRLVATTLDTISNWLLTSDGQCKEDQSSAEAGAQKESKAQTTAKSGASKLKKQSKLKSRDKRRQTDKERRQSFGGSRHR
ncbi:RlpA-like double-psi beta-barrel domain-containing protein [Phyllobacterium sp. K27]